MTDFLVSPSVSLVNGRPAVTSLQIAEHFGKRHDHVVRDIRRIMAEIPEELRLPNFGESSYVNEQGKEQLMFLVYRDGFMLLVMSYTGAKAMKIKIAYIAAFNAMEAELARKEQTAIPEAVTPSTVDDRKPLRSLVNAWARIANAHPSALWAQVKARIKSHFQLTRIGDLPVERIPEALAFVQGLIDRTPPRALPEPTLQATVLSESGQKALPGPNSGFLPASYPQFERDIQDIEKKIEVLCYRISLFASPTGMQAGDFTRNKPLIDAASSAATTARNACGAVSCMLKVARRIFAAMA
jgi:Rha family phage regulatory protein